MKTKYLILVLLSKMGFCQNLIQNGSLENFASTFMNGPGQGGSATNWSSATFGSPDYFNPGCFDVNYRVPDNITGHLDAFDGNAYVGVATFRSGDDNVGEYMVTTVNLLAGATYEFKMHISLASTCGFKTKIGLNIVQGFNTQNDPFNFIGGSSNNQKDWGIQSTANGTWEELSTTFVANASGPVSLIIGYFRDGNNNVASNSGNTGTLPLSDLAYYLIDDVSLIETEPPPPPAVACCPYRACYTNTSNLPALTLVTDYIKAGNAEGCSPIITNGPVSILSGQSVVFNAGTFIEIGNQEITPQSYTNIAGMDIQQGAYFEAKIEGCNTSNSGTTPPVHVVFLPTHYIRGNGSQYIANVENATNYHIEVINRFGFSVFEDFGVVNNNFPKLWDGGCPLGLDCTDGQYAVRVTFSNCNSTETVGFFWLMVTSPAARHSNLDTTAIDLPSLNNNSILLEENKNILIYPNPMNNEFNISSGIKFKKITIMDASGKLVYCSNFNATNYLNIAMESYQKGYYLLEIEDIDLNKHYHKLIKN